MPSDFEMPLSPVARNVSPSPTLAVDSRAKQLMAEGADVCGFGTGEPDFDTPQFIKDACIAALQRGETKYAANPGLAPLRAALADKYVNKHGVADTTPENVLVSPGGKYSCALAIQATCGPGDEVLIPAPYWVSYPEMVKLAGATPVSVMAGRESGFKVSAEQLEEAVTANTRMLILNTPSNPTGAVYARSEIESIAEFCLRHGLVLLFDEIYEDLLYDGKTHHNPASFSKELAAQTISVSGFSKSFSMTGWRLGTLVASAYLVKKIGSIQSQTTSAATTFAQYGALAVFEQPESTRTVLEEMRQSFDRRRLRLLEGLQAIPGIHCERAAGAFYLFPSVAEFGLGATDFATRLLDQEQVAVVPGEGFGADGYLRLSYAVADAVIDKGVERLKRFCEGL